MMPPISTLNCAYGVGKSVGSSDVPPIQPGSFSSRNTKICAKPMVKTVAMSRGALQNRRMMSSTTPPTSAEPTSITTSEAGYGHPWLVTSSKAVTAGTSPSPAWAKLTMRFARYTRMSPNASIA
jgi:hypothetical protein